MCGIAGILNFNDTADIQLPHVISMANAMNMRGPDDEGYVLFNSDRPPLRLFGEDTPSQVREAYPDLRPAHDSQGLASVVALGHRRLSIVDLSPGGHQPMSSASGRYWIVYNGEIYNYLDLRQELKSLGHHFRTESDTEVILAAYTEWKENCLGRFNGDFALALWDSQERSLFCARDRIGIKPFYYITEGSRFIFASDIKTLIASGLYSPAPDPQGLYLALAFGIAPRPITAFRGILALQQAHWMRVHNGGRIEIQRYWHIPVGTQDPRMTEADARELLEEQLQCAVRRRLTADVPVGTFMSGGIDSTTVSAMAAQMHPGIKAFTLGFKDNVPELDEVPQAVATARMHPMQHVVHYVDPNDSLKDIHNWVDGYEEPYYSGSSTYELSRVVQRNGVRVVLNGLGGDELFSGYSYYRYHDFPLNILFHKVATSIPDWILPRGANRILKPFRARTHDELHTVLSMQMSDNELRQLLIDDFHPSLDTPRLLHNLYSDHGEFYDGNEAISYMDLMNYIGNHQVHRIDQFTMAFSIEGRFPFLDHKLIEATFRIPTKFKIQSHKQKYLLRQVAAKYIAPECLTMKKKGFGMPISLWMDGPLSTLVAGSLLSLQGRREVRASTVRNWIKKYEAKQIAYSKIWHLVNLDLWFKRFMS
jgi:asparagine synthase (glutamine-hydrolysing)